VGRCRPQTTGFSSRSILLAIMLDVVLGEDVGPWSRNVSLLSFAQCLLEGNGIFGTSSVIWREGRRGFRGQSGSRLDLRFSIQSVKPSAWPRKARGTVLQDGLGEERKIDGAALGEGEYVGTDGRRRRLARCRRWFTGGLESRGPGRFTNGVGCKGGQGRSCLSTQRL